MRSSTASMDTLARNSVGAHPSMDPYSVGGAVGNAYFVDHQGMTVTVAPVSAGRGFDFFAELTLFCVVEAGEL